MACARLKLSILATLAVFAAGVAHAADYHPPPQPPPYIPPPPPQECCVNIDNWYLRGFVGAGLNGNYNLEISPAPSDGRFVSNTVGDSFFIGGGVGYYWNNWLRFDATAEYRAKTQINALFATTSPGPVAVDEYKGHLSSWIFLANAYVDLGTWDCWTPFVGAGIGAAYNTISDFTDVTPDVSAFGATGSSFGLGRGTSNWDLAWALYAGISYAVSKNFNIDLTYRYLHFGSAKETVDCNGGSGCNFFEFKDLHSNDIMLGLRWTCCETAPPLPPPPLQSRG